MTLRQTNRLTDQPTIKQTDMRGHMEVALPIRAKERVALSDQMKIFGFNLSIVVA